MLTSLATRGRIGCAPGSTPERELQVGQGRGQQRAVLAALAQLHPDVPAQGPDRVPAHALRVVVGRESGSAGLGEVRRRRGSGRRPRATQVAEVVELVGQHGRHGEQQEPAKRIAVGESLLAPPGRRRWPGRIPRPMGRCAARARAAPDRSSTRWTACLTGSARGARRPCSSTSMARSACVPDGSNCAPLISAAPSRPQGFRAQRVTGVHQGQRLGQRLDPLGQVGRRRACAGRGGRAACPDGAAPPAGAAGPRRRAVPWPAPVPQGGLDLGLVSRLSGPLGQHPGVQGGELGRAGRAGGQDSRPPRRNAR